MFWIKSGQENDVIDASFCAVIAIRICGITMPQRLVNFWTFLRHSSALAVWERWVRLTLLCILFIAGQSVPAVLALAAQGSDTWAVVCTGAGLQIVQLEGAGDGDRPGNAPQDLQSVCKCTLTRDTHSCISPAHTARMSAPELLCHVEYATQQNIAIAQNSKQSVSCRGPPAAALGNDTFSDPPPSLLVGHYFLRRFEKP